LTNTLNISLFVTGQNSLPYFAKMSDGEEFEMVDQKAEVKERLF